MSFIQGSGGRVAAVLSGLSLAAAGLAANASAEHTLLEQVSAGPAGGNGAFDAGFKGASRDGTRVFFETFESLVSADADTRRDVYARSGGQTSLVSTGPDGESGAFDAGFTGASGDGTRAFFVTDESLVTADSVVGERSRIAPRVGIDLQEMCDVKSRYPCDGLAPVAVLQVGWGLRGVDP